MPRSVSRNWNAVTMNCVGALILAGKQIRKFRHNLQNAKVFHLLRTEDRNAEGTELDEIGNLPPFGLIVEVIANPADEILANHPVWFANNTSAS